MADTSRCQLLQDYLGLENTVSLSSFITKDGYVRHPLAPCKDAKGNSWRETDSSSDQCLPFYLASGTLDKRQMKDRIRANYWRTGNNTPVSPAFFFELISLKLCVAFCLIVQALLFMLPFRWSDSKNCFESNADSSADYLNWIAQALSSYKLVRKMISKEKLKSKVSSYYSNEINSEWLVSLFHQAIDRYF
jgi:hypothetical protein